MYIDLFTVGGKVVNMVS